MGCGMKWTLDPIAEPCDDFPVSSLRISDYCAPHRVTALAGVCMLSGPLRERQVSSPTRPTCKRRKGSMDWIRAGGRIDCAGRT